LLDAAFDTTSYVSILMIGLALVFPPSSFAVELVKERQNNVLNLLFIYSKVILPIFFFSLDKTSITCHGMFIYSLLA